jgi:hypothetical protein
MQIYKDPEVKVIVKYRLQELTQQNLAIKYTTQFQIYAIQTK